MRSAPSVVFPVGRSAFYGTCQGVLAVLALVTAVLWAHSMSGRPGWAAWTLVGGLLAWAGWCLVAFHGWWRSPQGWLHWEAGVMPGERGEGGWLWRSQAYPDGTRLTGVKCVLDLQTRMCLRLFFLDRGSRWIWVERQCDPVHWSAMRRAVVAGG